MGTRRPELLAGAPSRNGRAPAALGFVDDSLAAIGSTLGGGG